MLKPGDPCPCCGQPIQTDDIRRLELLDKIKNNPHYRLTIDDLILLRFKGDDCNAGKRK